jgi:hypothetical protein
MGIALLFTGYFLHARVESAQVGLVMIFDSAAGVAPSAVARLRAWLF